MNTFQLIIEKQSNTHSNLIHILLRMVKSQCKIKSFIEQRNNVFLNSQNRDELTAAFCKIQSAYWSFTKIARIYKYKKSKIVIAEDLCMNPLIIGGSNVICIYQQNNRYLFTVSDIIKIINASLTHSDMFFSMPKTIRNPYNNVPFDKSTLYNIYFFVIYNTQLFPELFVKFFYCNFNITLFSRKYESLLRNYTIEHYVTMTSDDILHNDICDMIQKLNSFTTPNYSLDIHPDFPQKRLVKIMRPYLLLWLTACYSLVTIDADNAAKLLVSKYRRFAKIYPKFGRKIAHHSFIYMNYGRRNHITYTFNDDHPKFKSHTNFMNSHIL